MWENYVPPDQFDVLSYEEVIRLPFFERRTLVLLGKIVLRLQEILQNWRLNKSILSILLLRAVPPPAYFLRGEGS